MSLRRISVFSLVPLVGGQLAHAALFAQYLSGSYTQGTIYSDDSGDVNNLDMSFNDPTVVGDPTTASNAGLTDLDYGFAEVISPFDPPADADQIVTIGYGGSITLRFSQPIPVLNSTPTLGVFTGSGFGDTNYPNGIVSNPAATLDPFPQSATVSVSADGSNWFSLGLQPLDVPENFYLNASSAYQFPAPDPAQFADFGTAFSGTLNSFSGENYSQILSTLGNSAGGNWLNLSGGGLTQINYIQFSEPVGLVPMTSFVAINAVSASGLPNNGNITLGSSEATQTAQLAPGIGATTIASLTINTGSALDITTNPLFINYGTGPDPISTIVSYLADGQIESSTVNNLNLQKPLLYSLAYADGADGIISGLPSGEIEILPTLAGDANLSGSVTFYDFQLVLSNFGKLNQAWDQGDFDYSGAVDFYDFQVVLNNFGRNAGALNSAELAELNSFAEENADEELALNPDGGLSLASVPEPSLGILAAAGLLLRRGRRAAAMILFAASLLITCRAASAETINSIQFLDGNYLDVQGTYGTGADTAYLVIDFDNTSIPGADFGWQFNFDPSTPINGWQMLEDIAGNSNLTTSGVTGTTNVNNPSGDPNLTVTAEYFPSFTEHLVQNFQYDGNSGVNDWDFYTGSYNAASVSAGDPQGMSWTSSSIGIDDQDLSNNEFIGFVDVARHAPDPTLSETPLPPVGSAVGVLLAIGWFARRSLRTA